MLIVLEGAHQQIPDLPSAGAAVHLQSPPPADPLAPAAAPSPSSATPGTEADRLRERYKAIGESQNHKFGEGGPGAKPVDFNAPLPAGGVPVPKPAAPSTPPATPSTPPPAAPR